MSDVLAGTLQDTIGGGVDAATFRAALGQWPTGVTVVTTAAGGQWHGLTASSFSSVSLEPPLVMVCVARSAFAHDLISQAGFYAVTILGKDQAELGKRFARFDPALPDRFAGDDWTTAATGAPVLSNSLGWVDCRVRDAVDGGDHTIFIGQVMSAGTPRVTAPLLYHSRTWGQFADILPDSVLLHDIDGEGGARDIETDVPHLLSAPPRLDGDIHARPRVVVADAFAGTPTDLADALEPIIAQAPAEVVLADCGGTASPVAVREVCREVVLRSRGLPIGVRLSDTDGFGYANLLVALKSGVQRVDVGGCAMSRQATERLVARLGLTVAEAGA